MKTELFCCRTCGFVTKDERDMVLIEEKKGHAQYYSITDKPEHYETIKKGLEDGNEQSLIEVYGEETVQNIINLIY